MRTLEQLNLTRPILTLKHVWPCLEAELPLDQTSTMLLCLKMYTPRLIRTVWVFLQGLNGVDRLHQISNRNSHPSIQHVLTTGPEVSRASTLLLVNSNSSQMAMRGAMV
jgi:hypothetical protein